TTGHRVAARDGVARDRGAELRRLDVALRPRGDRAVTNHGDADVRLVSGRTRGARAPPVPAVRAGPPRKLAAAPLRPRRRGAAFLTTGRARPAYIKAMCRRRASRCVQGAVRLTPALSRTLAGTPARRQT